MDDQQHALAALLRTSAIVEAAAARGEVPSDDAGSAWLWLVALLAAFNPFRAALAVPRDDRSRRTIAGVAAVGGLVGSLLVLAIALASGPLVDALGVSDPALRLAVGVVAGVVGIIELIRRAPAPEPALPGWRAALVPVAVPSVAGPGLLVLALGADADRGLAVIGAALAVGVLADAARPGPAGGRAGSAGRRGVAAMVRRRRWSRPACCWSSTASSTCSTDALQCAAVRPVDRGSPRARQRPRQSSGPQGGPEVPHDRAACTSTTRRRTAPPRRRPRRLRAIDGRPRDDHRRSTPTRRVGCPAWSASSPPSTSGSNRRRCRATPAVTRALLATDRVRYVGEPIAAVVAETGPRRPTRRRPCFVDVRHARRRDRPRAGDVLRSSSLHDGVAENMVFDTTTLGMPELSDDFFADCEVVVERPVRQPARRALPAGGAGVGRRVGGRAAVRSGCHPARPRRPRATIAAPTVSIGATCVSSRPTSAADSAPRSASTPRSCCSAAGAAHSGVRSAGSRPGARSMIALGHGRGQVQHVEHRRAPRRDGHPLPAARHPGLRRLPRRRGGAAPVHDPADGVRRVRHRQHRVPHDVGRDEHHADRRLPGRRPAGGDRGDRAGDGPVRRRGRPRPGRGAAHQLHRPVRRAVHDGDRPDLRRRRLRRRARPRAGRGRLRRAARRAGAAAGRRRPVAARDRREHLRGDHRRRRRRSARRRRSRCAPTAAPSCTPAPHRTARGTTRRGR